MPSQKGLACNFAFGSAAGITFSGTVVTGPLMQSAQQGKESELASVRDGDGTTVTDIFYDERDTLELRFAVSSATNIATARTNTTLANIAPGTIVNITACAARPDVVQSNWIITEGGPRVEGDNTSIAMIVIPLRRRAGITSTAS